MADFCKIALDAMGGDNAPGEIVKGAIEALALDSSIYIYFVGKTQSITDELAKYDYDKTRVEIVEAPDVIETGDHPVISVRRKKESSLVKAMYLVKDGKADAFVSAGNSGAIIAGGQTIIGRVPGVERAPMAPLIPTTKGVSLLVDSGGNVDARPSFLVQWARMGSIYMRDVIGVENPRVAIVNIGLEEEKGNTLVKDTYPLLKECKDINFIGSIEAREIPNGYADVIVCDAFVGNVILKLYEGTASALIGIVKQSMMKNLKTKIGALLIKKNLKESMKSLDATQYGGAPLIGLNNLVVKTHGSAKAKEVKNTCIQCVRFKEQKIDEKIRAAMSEYANKN
jgi:glycerol-3-phosphate acyltransferase PlsX